MNNFELQYNSEEDYIDATAIDFAEAGHFYTVLDAALLIDEMGVVPFLEQVTKSMNNPMEQHVATQLLRIAMKHERVLLKMTPADHVLYEVNKDV
jgi:hypothetical protein